MSELVCSNSKWGGSALKKNNTTIDYSDQERHLERWLMNSGKPTLRSDLFKKVERDFSRERDKPVQSHRVRLSLNEDRPEVRSTTMWELLHCNLLLLIEQTNQRYMLRDIFGLSQIAPRALNPGAIPTSRSVMPPITHSIRFAFYLPGSELCDRSTELSEL